MNIKSIILLTVALGAASVAHAYNHKWLGVSSDAWSNGLNWTNNFPNPGENRAMRLFFPFGSSQLSTRQDVEGLVVDFMEINDTYRFRGGPGATLGIQDTNGLSSSSVSLELRNGAVFEDDLTLILTMPIGVWAQQTAVQNAVAGYFNGRIIGPGEFHQYGGGRLEFGGSQANTYTGVTWIHEGDLNLNKTGAVAIPGDLIVGSGFGTAFQDRVSFLQANQLATDAAVTLHTDGWLDLNNHSQTIRSLTMTGGRISTGSGQLTLGGNVTSHSADSQALVEGRLGLGFVPRTFTTTGYTNQCLHVMGRIAGDSGASLVKRGSGSLILSGTNAYHGATLIQQGTVVARGPSPLGSAVQGTVVSDGATLHLEFADLADEPLTVSGVGVDAFGAIVVFGATTGTGPVTLPEQAKFTLFHTLTLNGVVSGPGGMDVSLHGRLALGGDTANSYTGTTTVWGGIELELRKRFLVIGGGNGLTAVPGPLNIAGGDVRLFYDNQIADTAPVTFSHVNGQLDLNDQADTIGSLAGVAGQVLLGNGELTIGGNANSTTSAARISGTGGRLRKIGPGTLTLTGTNVHTGTTTVEGGALVINGTQAASAVIVKSNATLAGSGTVGTISSQGGIVSPGVGAGRLNSKGVAFDGTSAFRADINGQFAGVSYDQLNVAGAVHLSGSALEVALGFAGAAGNQYMIIANDGADAVIGTFAGKPQGTTFTAGGAQFQIHYQGGDGNDVVLTQLTASTQDFAPALAIEKSGPGQVRLLWTTNAVGFHLETATALSAAWSVVPGAPNVVADRFTVEVPATTNTGFFRLAKP